MVIPAKMVPHPFLMERMGHRVHLTPGTSALNYCGSVAQYAPTSAPWALVIPNS